MGNSIGIRVLEQDKRDEIRIGAAFPAPDLETAEKNIIAAYDKNSKGAADSNPGAKIITNESPL